MEDSTFTPAVAPQGPADRAGIISQFNKFGKMLERQNTLRDIAQQLQHVAETAEQVTTEDQDDWFDKHTVGRNMKEIKKYAEDFAKCAVDADVLHERLTALYDDMGMKLGRYFEIHDLQPEISQLSEGTANAVLGTDNKDANTFLMWSDKVGDVRVIACRHGRTNNSPVSLTVTRGVSESGGKSDRFTKKFDSETDLIQWYKGFLAKTRTGKLQTPSAIVDSQEDGVKTDSAKEKMMKMVSIVKKNQPLKVEGRLIDVRIAHGILDTFHKLNPANKAKFMGMPLDQMMTISHKLMGTTVERIEETIKKTN